MSTHIWLAADAARLKSLREKSEIDANQFARLTTISITQLQQLESDGDSAFYSPLIKYQVGKKLLNLFGETPTAEVAPTQPDDIHTLQVQPEADSIALDGKDRAIASLDKIAEVSNREYDPPKYKAIARSISLCWKEHVVFSLLVAAFLIVLIGNYFFKAPLMATPEKLFSGDGKVVVEASAPRLEITPPPVVSTTASAPIDAASSTIAATSAIARPTPTSSCLWTETPMTLKSPKPTKAAEYVYFVAVRDVTTCVIDHNKQTTTHSLKAGETQTVNGKAPFRIYSERMADVMIFFQGHRIIVPNKETDVLLLETPVTS